jgi:hypothetical protein
MDRDESLRNHYGTIVVIGYMLVIAIVIFCLHVSRLFHVCLWIVAAIVFAFMLRSAGGSDIPCGTSLEDRSSH